VLQKLPHAAAKMTAHRRFTIYYPTPPKKLPYTRLKLSPDEIAKVRENVAKNYQPDGSEFNQARI